MYQLLINIGKYVVCAIDNNADKINTIETENNGDTLKEVIDENESLRRGMHEILDCIRNRDSIYYFSDFIIVFKISIHIFFFLLIFVFNIYIISVL